jgi:hypothetical protein
MGRNMKIRADWKVAGGAFRIGNAHQNGKNRPPFAQSKKRKLYSLPGSLYGFCR